MRTPKLQLDAQAMERRMRKVGTTKDADVVAALLADNADLRRQVADLQAQLETVDTIITSGPRNLDWTEVTP